MILLCKYIIPKGYRDITLYPFVFLKDIIQKENVVLLNDERIHITPQKELLVLFFYVWYIVEFLIRLLSSKNWNTAHRNISFEREAYTHESNFECIKKRPSWAFF
ncbi:MAG: hypothetical protein HRT69_03045 [Flavobacteriaceae bacterium]|nr:hypothetical protein [Flavobacteriaceae bacterium]